MTYFSAMKSQTLNKECSEIIEENRKDEFEVMQEIQELEKKKLEIISLIDKKKFTIKRLKIERNLLESSVYKQLIKLIFKYNNKVTYNILQSELIFN